MISSYIFDIGPIRPVRPVLSTFSDILVFPTVTVGDTSFARLDVMNGGNDTLRISGIIFPFEELKADEQPTIILMPGDIDTILFVLAPKQEISLAGSINIQSNDPISPMKEFPVLTDIRSLDFTSRLLNPGVEVPLGERITVIVSPAESVRVERGTLYYRPSDDAVAFSDTSLTVSGNDFIGIIPGADVTERNLDYYIEVENSGIFSADPPGAPDDSLFYQAVQQPASISTSPVPNRESDFMEGVDIKVSVELPEGAIFGGGTLFYRRGGDSLFSSVDITEGELYPQGAIPDSVAGPRGVEYYAEVQTMTRTLTDPPSEPELSPRCIRITSEDLEESSSHDALAFRLLSIPLKIDAPITGVVTDDIGGPDNTAWRMFAYENESGGYIELPSDSIFNFNVGTGYWLITREEHRLDTAPAEGLSTPTDSAFALELKPGYNLIGDPFCFAVAWDSVLVDTLGSAWLVMADAEADALEPAVRWNAERGYVYDVSLLEPFDGYWVKNLLDKSIFLRVPPKEAAVSSNLDEQEQLASGTSSGEGWVVKIKATSGTSRDLENYIGIRPDGSDSWDSRDRSEAPLAPGRSLSLYFPRFSWKRHPGRYSQDIRSGYRDVSSVALSMPELSESENLWGQVWSFDVAKSYSEEGGGDEVILEFEGIESVPAEAVVYLVDWELERLLDVREGGSYSFYLGERLFIDSEGEARFALVVGSADFAEEQELPAPPAETALHQNYPNPFNPSTVIRYDVAKAGEVLLSIYDATGALVRELYRGRREPGRYEAAWSGENDRGAPVVSGIYFYRLKTQDRTVTRKMVLLR